MLQALLTAFPPPPLPGWAFTLVGAVLGLVLGLCLGSFATALSWRRPRGISIVLPPSRCTSCGTRLTALDLIPIGSWLMSKGRCRHCGAPVSARYPLIEAGAGLAGMAIALLAPSMMAGLCLFVALPLVIAWIVIRFEAGTPDWPLLALAVLPLLLAAYSLV